MPDSLPDSCPLRVGSTSSACSRVLCSGARPPHWPLSAHRIVIVQGVQAIAAIPDLGHFWLIDPGAKDMASTIAAITVHGLL